MNFASGICGDRVCWRGRAKNHQGGRIPIGMRTLVALPAFEGYR